MIKDSPLPLAPTTVSPVINDDGLVPRRGLRKLVPVSDMTIHRWMKAGEFPEPVKIHGRNYWRAADIAAWIASREPGAAAPPPPRRDRSGAATPTIEHATAA